MDRAIKENPLMKLLRNRGQGRQMGLWSCCSANEYVIRAALRRGKATNTVVLIEATANQVDQNGGYTGMTPERFRSFVTQLANEEMFPPENVFLGGDHLGPLTWKTLPERIAMKNASALVESYILAGFSKIHLDTSMCLGDDNPDIQLSDKTVARRGAELCAVAEAAFVQYQSDHPEAPAPIYVIGSEVPVPGGAMKNEDYLAITSPESCRTTLVAFREAFLKHGLENAWNRVVGIVVQPGVEFADESVIVYDRCAAKALNACLMEWPGMVYEGHSTDYQPRKKLREMVEDGIAVLKVGPALTFALREGLYALENIEKEHMGFSVYSNFRNTLESVMMDDNRHWVKYYHGTSEHKKFARSFSFSDRARYYLSDKKVSTATFHLMENFGKRSISLALLSQYFPLQYRRVRDGVLKNQAEDILLDYIGDRIDDYIYATLR